MKQGKSFDKHPPCTYHGRSSYGRMQMHTWFTHMLVFEMRASWVQNKDDRDTTSAIGKHLELYL
jgi:hypothetical protein